MCAGSPAASGSRLQTQAGSPALAGRASPAAASGPPLAEPASPTHASASAAGAAAHHVQASRANSRSSASSQPHADAPTNRSLDHELEQAGPAGAPPDLPHPVAASLDAALDRHELAAAALRQRLLEGQEQADLVQPSFLRHLGLQGCTLTPLRDP